MEEGPGILSAYYSALRLLQLLQSMQVHHKYNLLAVDLKKIRDFEDKIRSWMKLLDSLNSRDVTRVVRDMSQRFSQYAFKWSNILDYHVVDQKVHDIHLVGEEFRKAMFDINLEIYLLCEKLKSITLQPASIRKESSSSLRSTNEEMDHLPYKKTKEAILVGIERPLQKIKEELVNGVKDRQVIAIVGMGGSGKTALARKVYEDFSVTRKRFDECYWITVSQEYDVRKILQKILDDNNTQEVRDLGTMLHQKLFDHKYLIALDDLWSPKAWEELVVYFPNRNNGSRIIVTTRELNVAKSLSPALIHQMDLLDEEASWELLSKKVPCPDELQGIGREIARNCKGLPLSIVTIGGLLSKSDMSLQFWKNVADAVTPFVSLEDDERCMKTLYLSYHNMPPHLKLCFLSFSYYPEDAYIKVNDLIQWWIVEMMVRPEGGRGMEEVALDYLKDLIGRNMIFVREYNDIMEIEQIGIHDLLFELCRKESSIENVFVGAGMDGFCERKKKSPIDIQAMRCLGCSTTYFVGFYDTVPMSNSSTRLCYGRIFHQILSVLRVDNYVYTQLCLECNRMVVMELFIYGVHPIFSISSIFGCKGIKVPHFHGMNEDIISFESLQQYHFPENLLWNVQQCLNYEKCSFRMMPQLKFLDSVPNQDEEDIVLEQLIGLDCESYGGDEPFLPKSIKRLGICGDHIESILEAIRDMPNLELLAINVDYCGPCFGSRSLRYLGISHIYRKGRLEIDCPRLERLWLQNVPDASFCLCDDSSLQSIRLDGCGESTVQSAMEILERKRSLGNKSFYVEKNERMEFDGSWRVSRVCRVGLEDEEFAFLEMMMMGTQIYHKKWRNYSDVIKYLNGFDKARQREHFFVLGSSRSGYRGMSPIPNNTAVRFPNLKNIGRMRKAWDGSPLPSLLKELSLVDTLIDEARTTTIMELQNLEVLDLWGCKFENGEWCNLSQGKFTKLKKLGIHHPGGFKSLKVEEEFTKLKELGIHYPGGLKSLKVEEDQFPQLLSLQISGGSNICDITCNITTLSSIQLWHCRASTIIAAKKILRKRKYDCADEYFYVMIDGELLTLEEEEEEKKVEEEEAEEEQE